MTSETDKRIRYAAYGSNLHPARLTARLPSANLLGNAFVPGHSLLFDKRSKDGSAKCGIESGGDGIHVAVFNVSEDERGRLDEIEGVGHGYQQIAIEVPGFGCCFAYEATPSHICAGLPAYDWYREFVLLGCRFHGFPDDYVAEVAAKTVTFDADPTRRRRNWGVIVDIHSYGA